MDNKKTIKYVSGGKLGDFINQLSVINEKYLETGIKGTLYIGYTGDIFTNKIKGTYEDTYEIIKEQPYIENYTIHNGEKYDVDLSEWRKNIKSSNFHNIFSEKYNVDWGKNKWLLLENKEKYYNDKWCNVVFLNTTKNRFKKLDYQCLYDKYGDNLVFISSIRNDYEYFTKITGIQIKYYSPLSFLDLCVAINSCKLFVGGLSMPLTIAFALKKEIVIACPNNNKHFDHALNCGYDKLWENIKYL